MSAPTTASARRAKKQARLAAVPQQAQAQAKKAKKPRKSKRHKKQQPSLGRATVQAVRGQMTPAALAAAIRAATVEAVPNGRWRSLAYNGSAAGAGHCLLWGVSGDPMAGAEFMADINLSLVPVGVFAVTCTAAYAAWKAGGLLRGLPLLGLAARPAAALGAAFWGQGTGPLITEFMAWSAPWSALLAPLAVAGAFGSVCWLYLERHAARWARPLRWAARIPLATVVLSSALYSPGALL